MATVRVDQAVELAIGNGFRATRTGRTGSRARRGSREEGTFERAFWPTYQRGQTDRMVRDAEASWEEARRRQTTARRTGTAVSAEDAALARLTRNQFAVLRALADYARNCRGKVYPSLDTIAHVAAIGRRTVVRALQALEELGLIERQRRYVKLDAEGPGPRVRQTSNVYRLKVPKWLSRLLPAWRRPKPLPADEEHRQAENASKLAAMVESLSCENAVGFHTPADPELAAILRRLGRAVDRENASAKKALNSPPISL